MVPSISTIAILLMKNSFLKIGAPEGRYRGPAALPSTLRVASAGLAVMNTTPYSGARVNDRLRVSPGVMVRARFTVS